MSSDNKNLLVYDFNRNGICLCGGIGSMIFRREVLEHLSYFKEINYSDANFFIRMTGYMAKNQMCSYISKDTDEYVLNTKDTSRASNITETENTLELVNKWWTEYVSPYDSEYMFKEYEKSLL